ncbi:MAG: helix-turn-helix domain-containing protein [Blastochloris sp.]|nr:helix-turn-helix domain-containing protein [Blastochloris sp.]
MYITQSLEDLRQTRYLTVADFAAFLGISPHTYRRLLALDTSIQLATKRRIADRLGRPPHVIAELVPPLSDTYVEALTAAITTANTHGWYAGDPATGAPTDDLVVVVCPPGTVPEQQPA